MISFPVGSRVKSRYSNLVGKVVRQEANLVTVDWLNGNPPVTLLDFFFVLDEGSRGEPLSSLRKPSLKAGGALSDVPLGGA